VNNLGEISNITNGLLQGKGSDALNDASRLAINSTLGIGGLMDLATMWGLEQHDEDLGQTLGRWEVSPGPYPVLPLLGPTTLRDVIARPLDVRLDPIRHVGHIPTRHTGYGSSMIHGRAGLIGLENSVFGDRYLFFRDAYLQRREFLVHDGEVEDEC
jgi:phospholipid-binding lipoprotein MlaA